VSLVAEARAQDMENIFIHALVRAGTCAEHQKFLKSNKSTFTSTYHRDRRKLVVGKQEQVRFIHDQSSSNKAHRVQAPLSPTQEELKNLLDYYEGYQKINENNHTNQEEPNPTEPPPGPDLDSIWQDDVTRDGRRKYHVLPPETEEDEQKLSDLEDLLADVDSSHEDIYAVYRSLPTPRFSYIPPDLARKLIGRFSVIEFKTEAHMIRFLSMLDDMKAAGVPIKVREWSTAIHLAGRCLKRPTSAEVENALYVWREMEKEAGVSGNVVTFNILFDIATKANKFTLAGMILREMERRQLPLDRYFRTSHIYYHGCRGDADGVRRAYRELVEAGEIVDTTVLNSVISALLRCHEPAAAEQVFERMKTMHAQKAGGALPPRSWREARQLGRMLDRASKVLRAKPTSPIDSDKDYEDDIGNDSTAHSRIQALAPVAPDRITFQILLKHHAVVAGDFARVRQLLAEMDLYEVPRSTGIFVHLLCGFSAHHAPYGAWSREALERLLVAVFRRADEEGLVGDGVGVEDNHGVEGNGGSSGGDSSGFRWDVTLVGCLVDAFARIAGRERAVQVWEEVRTRWAPEKGEEETVLERLEQAVQQKGPAKWRGPTW